MFLPEKANKSMWDSNNSGYYSDQLYGPTSHSFIKCDVWSSQACHPYNSSPPHTFY